MRKAKATGRPKPTRWCALALRRIMSGAMLSTTDWKCSQGTGRSGNAVHKKWQKAVEANPLLDPSTQQPQPAGFVV